MSRHRLTVAVDHAGVITKLSGLAGERVRSTLVDMAKQPGESESFLQDLGVWWRSRALRSEKTDRRIKAVDRLSSAPAAKATAPLIEALSDPDPEVRVKAITGLGEAGQAQAIEPIVALLLKETDREALHAGIRSLQRLDRNQVSATLLKAMDAPDPAVSLKAASTLRKVGWEEVDPASRARAAIVQNAWDDAIDLGAAAIGPLRDVIRDGTRRMKREAAHALGAIGSPQALSTLMGLMSDTNADDAARDVAAWSISKFFWNDLDEQQAASMALAQRDWIALKRLGAHAVGVLRAALADMDEAIRPEVVTTLGKIGGVEAARALEEALSGGKQDVAVRESAALALGTTGDRGAIRALVSALSDEAWTVRGSALGALRALEWQPTGGAEKALAAVLDKDWDAATNLGGVAIAALRGALQYMSVSMPAARALAGIGDAGVDALVVVLRDETQPMAVREVIATTLASLGDARAIEPMLTMLNDSDMAIRQQAVWTLEKVGWEPKDDRQRATVAVAHADWAALTGLGQAAIEPLILLATNSMMPEAAAIALQELLQKSSGRLSINQLRDLAALTDAGPSQPAGSPLMHGAAKPNHTDSTCGKIRQLARWELLRRGIMF